MKNWKFEYGGKVFEPHRRLTGAEIMYDKPILHTSHDSELGFVREGYPHSKFPYDFDRFYEASTAKDCDLFFCVSNGRMYLPGQNQLFRWKGPIGPKDSMYANLKETEEIHAG